MLLLHVLVASAAATAPPSQPTALRARERSAIRPQPLALTRLRGGGGGGGGLDWRYFVAGSISAGLSHGYTTPIDVVKTRMQTNPELYNGSVALAVRRILDDEGALFLLQGLGPTLIGYGLEGALKFGSYEMAKPLFAHVTPSTMVNYLLASCVAGALASTVLCPAEEVRIKLVADPEYASSALGALMRMSSEKGVFASLSGFPAMCAKQVPYTMGKQVSFDFLCSLVAAGLAWLLGGDRSALVTKLAPIIAALPAAVCAAVLSHPGDSLLTAYYKGSSDTLAQSVRRVLRERGVAGLFVGLQARLLHVIGIIWVQLVMYDRIKVALGLPATGGH